MAKYRKQPVVIDAHQLPLMSQETVDGFIDWAHSVQFEDWSYDPASGKVTIPTLEGTTVASPGDWVIKGVEGEFYACKPTIFAKTYERAEDSDGNE